MFYFFYDSFSFEDNGRLVTYYVLLRPEIPEWSQVEEAYARNVLLKVKLFVGLVSILYALTVWYFITHS
jgi:hypothetical protein